MTSSIGGSSTFRSSDLLLGEEPGGRRATSPPSARAASPSRRRGGSPRRSRRGRPAPFSSATADRLVGRERVGQPGEVAVEQDPPVVDDDDALAERLDVRHVVAREQHGRAVAPRCTRRRTRGCASASSRRARSSARRGRAPAAGGAASRRSRPSSARRARAGGPACARGRRRRAARSARRASRGSPVARDPVDRAVELEGVERRQVPLELVPVAHDERDLAQEVTLALRGDVAEDARLPARLG